MLAIVSSIASLAQNTVSGKVSDNSGKGISGASLTAGGGRGTTTDAEGRYSLSVPNGSVTINVSFVGFFELIFYKIENGQNCRTYSS